MVGSSTPTANAVLIGVALLAAALGAMLAPGAWEEWTGALRGVWRDGASVATTVVIRATMATGPWAPHSEPHKTRFTPWRGIMDIANHVFIVTGGASGLGEGTARMLARDRKSVV